MIRRINFSGKSLVLHLALITGLLLSGIIFALVYSAESRLHKVEFDIIASDRANIIINGIRNNIEQVEAIGYLYKSSASIEPDEFRTFVSGILEKHPEIMEFRWLKKVKNSDRKEFESADANTAGFVITELDKTGQLIQAKNRDVYFPITYVEPYKEWIKKIIGFDAASMPERLHAIERARDTGQPAIIAETQLIGEPEFKSATRTFLPIYANNSPYKTIEERRDALQGFVVMLFNVDRLVDILLKNMRGRGIDTYIYDTARPAGDKLICLNQSMTRPENAPAPHYSEAQIFEKNGFFWRGSFQIADDRWTIICRPAPEFFKRHKHVLSWIIFLLCLFITATLTIYLHNLTTRTKHIELLVKEKTDKLNLANKEWERTFNSIADFIFILDKNCTIVKANDSFLNAIHKNSEDVIGKKCFEIVHSLSDNWPNCPAKDTIQQKTAVTREVNDPNIGAPLLVTTSPILNPDGSINGIVHIARNISKLKEAETQIRQAVEIKSRFTSLVSHELRTPLGPIKEGAGIILDGLTGEINARQRDLLNTIVRNADRLYRLINSVLDFQKLESGAMNFNIVENNLHETINEVYKTMKLMTDEKGLRFTLAIDPELPRICFDRDAMVQVLMNLVNNAIKFTDKGGITIMARKENNAVHVTIEDTGPGISKENIPKLFQTFSRLDTPTERKVSGTGLGLAISREIVLRHKGKIWVESEPGKGSSFHFLLPVEERRG